MSFLTRQRRIFLLAAVMVTAVSGISYAQLDLKGKAIETLTNGVMKELDKKFAEMIAKQDLSAAVKTSIVKNLSEMSRPIVKNFIDSASSGKLPNVTEVVNSVMRDITPRVQELVSVALTEGLTGSAAQIAGQAPTTTSISSAVIVSYDDEKDFTVEIIKESNSARITKYNGKNTEIKIPPRIGDHPVTEIGERVFMKKGLVNVAIPDSVVFIGNMAFADNQIISVSIGANVYISNNAFDNSVYNSLFTAFYNNQGRKAGTYTNGWSLTATAVSMTSAGTTTVAVPAGSSDSAPLITQKPARQPKEPKAVEPETDNNARLWTLGVSVGSAFTTPLMIGTLHGTIAPVRNFFLNIGCDFGMVTPYTNVDYYSIYPFVHAAGFVPFTNKGGWYAGAGVGVMIVSYEFNSISWDSDGRYGSGSYWDTIYAVDLITGFNIGNFFDISYTLRTNFKGASNKLSAGFVYRFK